jgi:hypothetical protein
VHVTILGVPGEPDQRYVDETVAEREAREKTETDE